MGGVMSWELVALGVLLCVGVAFVLLGIGAFIYGEIWTRRQAKLTNGGGGAA